MSYIGSKASNFWLFICVCAHIYHTILISMHFILKPSKILLLIHKIHYFNICIDRYSNILKNCQFVDSNKNGNKCKCISSFVSLFFERVVSIDFLRVSDSCAVS